MTMQTVSYKRGYLHYNTDNGDAVRAQNDCGESKEFLNERAAKAWLNRYNGHKDWTHWNVSLWINNDEGLYRMAQLWTTKGCGLTRQQQAGGMLRELNEAGRIETPDGARYTVSTIKAAMIGM